jgi:hypothetical protein
MLVNTGENSFLIHKIYSFTLQLVPLLTDVSENETSFSSTQKHEVSHSHFPLYLNIYFNKEPYSVKYF